MAATSPQAPHDRRFPLGELRVLDLSRLLPGGYATQILADMGADVIKVEQPEVGDYLRWMPPLTSQGVSGLYEALNRGKRSITCNLRRDEGVEVFRDLVRTADVLVESFRPGVLDRLGVGYADLARDNPRLVYVAITGYGQTGPYTAKAGHDINYLGYAGGLSMTGHPGVGPTQPGLQIGDLGGGMAAVIAVLTALRERAFTGAGQFCDVSMTDVCLSWLSMHAGAFAATGEPPGLGSMPLNGGYACYGTYCCADGEYVTVGALERQFFVELLDGLDLPAAYADWQYLPERQDELRAVLSAAFAAEPRDAWLAAFAGRDACVGPVNDIAEAFADPSARERGMVVDDTLPDGTSFPRVGPLLRFSRSEARVGGSPSPLGADSDELLAELGRDAERIAWLRREGIV